MRKLALGALFVGLTIATACGGGKNSDGKITDVTPPDSDDGSATPDAPPTCDPIAQTGCGASDRCTWIWDLLDNPDTTMVETQVGHLGCAPTSTGTVAVNGTCIRSGPSNSMVEGTGASVADNCSKGSYCLGTTCKSICSTLDAASCGPDALCSRYSGIFVSMGMTVAGVCDLRCNPLTQATTATTSLAACNSTDPANPNVGCFESAGASAIGRDFSCARVPTPAKGLRDHVAAYGPADGGFYANGCDAGYLPIINNADDTTIRMCAGTCAPKNSDSANPSGSIGDPSKSAKLVDVATPRVGDGLCTAAKKGSNVAEDCAYFWTFNIDRMTMMLPDSPYNDGLGICLPYSDYTIKNPDPACAMPNPPAACATPIGYPSCSQLPPKGQPKVAPYFATADEFGCYDSVMSNPPMMHSALKRPLNFQVASAKPGDVVYRHILL